MLSKQQANIESFFRAESALIGSTIHFSNYLNTEKHNVIEINLESQSKLGLVLIYDDSYVYIDIHDKSTADPIFNASFSFRDFSELVGVLKVHLIKKWN